MRDIFRLAFTGLWLIGCAPSWQPSAAWHPCEVTVSDHQQATACSPPPLLPSPPTGVSTALVLPLLQSIVITAGPLSQPYKVLGIVEVDTRGLSLQASHQVNARLRLAAWQQWGLWVDAVIHVTYRNDEPGGDIYVAGVAVHVLEPYLLRLEDLLRHSTGRSTGHSRMPLCKPEEALRTKKKPTRRLRQREGVFNAVAILDVFSTSPAAVIKETSLLYFIRPPSIETMEDAVV